MRILFEELTAPLRIGGIEVACCGLATRLLALGHDLVRHDGTERLPVNWQPNVVHVHGIWSPALVRRWRFWRSAGAPCVVTVHGMLEPWALSHKKWKKRIAWLVYQRGMLQSAACLHATSDREAENLQNMGLRSAIATIPWGIEVEDENGGMQTGGRDLRNVIGSPAKGSLIQDSRRTALFVGRLYPVKGLPLLLQAWARVRPSGWKLRLVGPDEDGHQIELEALVGKFGLSEVVEFTGSLEREALASAYRDAELFVLPSYTENFGMVVGEAMACGRPVIASQGTPWQILEREKCGWWAPVSVDGIAAALADATLRSPKELLAIGARGRKVVSEQFCWDKIAMDFISCYERALGSQEKPSYI